MRRPLLILLVGVIFISILELLFSLRLENYEIGQNQHYGQGNQEHNALLGRFVIPAFIDGAKVLWHLIETNHDAIVAAFTIGIFLVTAALAGYTKKLWGSTKELVQRSEASTQITERAYVKMSHIQPGITSIDKENRTFKVFIEVQNFGRTPARVTSVVVNPIVISDGPLPEIPDYGPPQISGAIKRAFLVTDENFLVEQRGTGYTTEIERGEHTLYLVGYVDYIDIFGQRHRGGYGRVHRPQNESQNLVFVTQPGYNYDRPRKQGEGNDWDEMAIP